MIRGEKIMFNNILLAADGSEHSIRAAVKAIALVKLNPNAKIVVVYVVDGKTSKRDALHNLNTAEISLAREEKIEKALQKAKESGVNYETQIIRGEEPGPTIVKFANDNNIDVIVIGSRGLNALQEFVLGSVSHKVAKMAKCPVMIVK
jgi:nucleotide-binding universal stress UspA family protein